ncbi:MAG TPA: UDP-N-acetylmuramoyl-tripeptide--D-alanyl-D-alanine ligase [Chiayiivirga sp.]|nr:UDP-N-acetylmuramoyl-tripeptide--D-alanyl-D-alanine ligase [Chiayiivirga sp.]
MKPLLLSQLTNWTQARLTGADRSIEAIGTDTRHMQDGSLYVALRGETFDGHDFATQAEANGAVALLVERELTSALPQIVCSNSLHALAAIATAMAQTRQTRVLAITGSNGKTTTRSLTMAILRRVDAGAYSTIGNRNNEVGMPLAVIDQPEDARLAVYELGAGAPGDIAYLAAIARPNISVVTNVAAAHLERMGSLMGVADTKAAIYDALPADGIAVINADDAFAPYFTERAGTRQIVRYGIEASADVHAEAIVEDDAGSHFRLLSPWGGADINLPLPGRHQISNALAAASLALSAGASLESVAEGLAHAERVPGRQQPNPLPDGGVVLDDSYNANPGSMSVAISMLVDHARRDGLDAWLVLGDMRELGQGAAVLHADAGRLARDAGVKCLLAVGEMSRHATTAFGPGGEHFADQSALIERLRARGTAPVVMLVKGSRGSRMDRVVSALLNAPTQEDGHAA